jgi:hypothetical protein
VSEIPFVNALGDAIERAAAQHRGRFRRRLVIGGLGVAIAVSGVAAAASGVLSGSPEQLATSSISCYSSVDLKHANVAVLSAGIRTPIEACRRALRTDRPLVACAGPEVIVLPGPPGTCEKLRLKPLPADYAAARRKVNRLTRKIAAIEATKDCWEPQQLAARVQALLDSAPGWRAWRSRSRRPVEEGRCGTVTHSDGAGARSVDDTVDVEGHTVDVMRGPARSTVALLDRLGDLATASLARCYDREGAEALARERLAASGRTVTFDIEHLDGGSVKEFQDRIDEGCSVIPGFRAADDGYGIVVTIRE